MEAETIVLGSRLNTSVTKKDGRSARYEKSIITTFLPVGSERRSRMDLGARIKYHRKKQNMELEELAEGLLSPAELKKIELGDMAPSADLHKALCEKLRIPLAPVENPIGQQLIEQFKELLLHPQDRVRIRELYSMISEHPLLNIDEEIEIDYSIQLIRFFIVTGDLDSAEEKIEDMEQLKEFMNQEQYFLFHKYCGTFQYMNRNFETALNLYLLAEKIAPANISPTECGDLYYSIGISSTQVKKNEAADKYTRMALAIYEEEFLPKRVVECHINLGISQQRMKNLRSSIEHLKTALKISKKLDFEHLLYVAEYNCGVFYFMHGEIQSAIFI
ncbi:tetratricopeptide repeat protein [Indiicoccus explosivorum]|uniref:tetratricopeptide repeat protein n=1 Tax=Indiicoccus explosivorum TaxID=1917864 RepID=UPI000B43A224|nr:tetratricopeptide repeat protein [Indiicoccus explosivorum]